MLNLGPLHLGTMELVIILVVVLLIFGPKNLPKLGNAIGRTVKNLRSGMEGDEEKKEEKTAKDADADDDVQQADVESVDIEDSKTEDKA